MPFAVPGDFEQALRQQTLLNHKNRCHPKGDGQQERKETALRTQETKKGGSFLTRIFIPQKGDTSRQIAGKIIADAAVLLILAALVAGGLVIHKYSRNSELQEPAKNYPQPESMATSSRIESVPPEEDFENLYMPETPVLNPELGILDDFTELYETNPDVVGYLRIPGTPIDTAVVQGEDNVYYLDHTIEKTYNAFGVPYADYRARIEKDYQSDNITIYGHAARDGSLFGAVKEYSDVEYYREHPVLTFDTIHGKAQYKVVAAFLARVYTGSSPTMHPEEFNYHMFVEAEGNSADFDQFMEDVYKRSYWINEDVDVSFGDKLITLSTCDSEINAFAAPTDYRRVLIARRMRQGENMNVDVSKAVANEDMIMPKAWQDKFGKENPYK